MKVAILAGGLGTRQAEETDVRPKPMVEIGDQPLLWHIMKHYETHGFANFYIAGYKGEVIKRYFRDYRSLAGSINVSLQDGNVVPLDRVAEQWDANLIDTGTDTDTGGRLKRLAPYLGDAAFMLTYGDGVSDVNLKDLLAFHKAHGKLATITAVHPPSRFGEMIFDGDEVARFTEKPQMGEGWINGGFMVLEPAVLEMLDGDDTGLESELLEHLARDRQLVAYQHRSFWQCMDTLRDVRYLRERWAALDAPWKTWA